jgi:superfamily II RNA helicase
MQDTPILEGVIERIMNKGCLDAIFSTSTVAAGVNFPARTVVFYRATFQWSFIYDLTATELHQMTGRAGRRVMDNIGFVMLIPGIHQNVRLIQELIHSNLNPL